MASTEPFDWQIDPSHVRICVRPDGSLWKLGSGAMCTVFKAVLDDVNDVAVKRLSAAVVSQAEAVQLAKFKEEIQLMAACRHRNVVQFFGASLNTVSSRVEQVCKLHDCWATCAG